MQKLKLSDISSYFLFMTTLISSYFMGLLFYDSTTGLDFGKYFQNVRFFSDKSINLVDSNGSIYFFIISKMLDLNQATDLSNEGYFFINNVIQFTNFILYLTGILGLFMLFKSKGFMKNEILISLSILNFFPVSMYLRLTMKPEIFAFLLLPWIIFFIEKYFLKPKKKYFILIVFLTTIILTLKASITGMVILIFLYIFKDRVINFRDSLKLFASILFGSLIFIYFNFKMTNLWLFSKPGSTDLNSDRWNYTADLSFFTNIDFRNLYENPFQYIHSDSFISIMLLDTLSDYFHFFWNHKEDTNLIAFNRVKFTNNFLIQEFIQQYISIIFTSIFYIFIVYLIFKKQKEYKYLTFPFFGLLILIINSQGFPSKNFDPTTGDLFKVHYYSFLLMFSFFVFNLILYKKYNIFKFLSLLMIPIFIISMGFPKQLDLQTRQIIEVNFENTLTCHFLSFLIEKC